MKRLVLVGALLFATSLVAQVLAKQYKTMALGPWSVGVVCLDGQQPKATNNGLFILISCPRRAGE